MAAALEQFIALTERGLDACAAADVDAVTSLLEARAEVAQRMEGWAQTARSHGLPRIPTALASRATEATRLNATLAERAAALRRDVGAQIARLQRTDAGGQAYAGDAPPSVFMDLRR